MQTIVQKILTFSLSDCTIKNFASEYSEFRQGHLYFSHYLLSALVLFLWKDHPGDEIPYMDPLSYLVISNRKLL